MIFLDYYALPNASDTRGIYEFFNKTGNESWRTKKLAIIKDPKSEEGNYHLIYLEGENFDWIEGELKATVIKTLSPSDFKLRYYMSNKSLVDGSLTLLANAINIFIGGSSAKYVKVYW